MNDPNALLLTPLELSARLSEPDQVVVDCRFNLAQPDAGQAAYRAGHIPGAVYAHLDRDLSGPRTATSGRHPLPAPDDFSRVLGSWGIGPATAVTAYDDAGGAIAARLWWLLRWMGHRRVGLLDGGLKAWQAAGLPLATDTVQPRQASFRGSPGRMPTIAAEEIEDRLGTGRLLLIDVRARARFRGEEEPIDPIAGHVPGAVNAPFVENLYADGNFRSATELRAAAQALIGARDMRDVAVMCGSGVTACQGIFALELAGIPGARLYPGSWSEWIRPGNRPVVRS